MTDRPPPSLGTYRPPLGKASDAPRNDDGALPRIVTARMRDGGTSGSGGPRKGRRPQPPTEPDGMSWQRVVLYCALGLMTFVAAAGVAASVLVPTDLIGDRLRAEVKARTGRDLVIAGRSSLSLWPRPTVIVRDVGLSGPLQMGSQPLITASEIEVAVQILPLLLHEVTVDRLVLRRPVIDLRIDPQGRRSWDFAAAAPTARFAQSSPPNVSDLPKELRDFVGGSTDGAGIRAAPRPLKISDLSLANVGIADGRVRYRDERTGIDETVSALNAQVSLPNLARPLDTAADLIWRGEPMHITAQVSPVRALLEGHAVEAQIAVSAAPLSVTFAGTVLPATILDIDGRVTASATSLERVARWTGRSPVGLLPGGFSIEANLKQSGAVLALNDARVTLGALKGNGTLGVDTHGPRPSITGAIRVATLDLGALTVAAAAMPPGSHPGAAAPPTSIEEILGATTARPAIPAPPGTPPATLPAAVSAQRDGWSDVPFDLSPLGLLDADVRLGFDQLVWRDLATGPGQIALSLKAKVARVTLEDVQLYDGHARGLVTVDGRGTEAVAGCNLVADGVSALPFLKAIGGFDWLAGRAHTAVAIGGRGATERQIVGTLTGKADIAVSDGALLGLNLSTVIRNLALGQLAGLDRSPSEKTTFSTFAASTVISNGTARNDDLRITSADLSATGSGTIDLPQRTMDYLLQPHLTAAGGLEIPLKISGSIDRPMVTPQLAGLLHDPNKALQAVDAVAKTPAGKEIQDTVKGLLKGDPAARAKAKGFLDQLFKR